jgi:hypothetical protein
MASNVESAKNDDAGTVGARGSSGQLGQTSGNRPPLAPFGAEQRRGAMRAAGFEPATPAL